MSRQRTPRTLAAVSALVALLASMAMTATAHAAPPPAELVGSLARVDARIMFETVVGCEDGDTTCRCTHLGTAGPEVRTPDGRKVQARRLPVAVLGPCDLGDRIRVRGELATLLEQRPNGRSRLVAAAGEATVRGSGEQVAVNVGTTPSVWVPATFAKVVFEPNDHADVEVAYPQGRDGYLDLGPDGYLVITMERLRARFLICSSVPCNNEV